MDHLDIDSSFEQLSEMLVKIQFLSSIKDVVNVKQMTASMELLIKDDFASAGLEASAAGISEAVVNAIKKFATGLKAILSKVIAFIQNFFKRKHAEVAARLNELDNAMIKSIQEESVPSGYSKNEVMELCKRLSSHFTYKPKEIEGSNTHISQDEARRRHLDAFNRSVDGNATVSDSYILNKKPVHTSDATLKKLGYTSKADFDTVAKAIETAITDANKALTTLKNSSPVIDKVVSATANVLYNEPSQSVAIQGIFVYARIVYNDIKLLESVESTMVSVIAKAHSASKKFAKVKD